MSIFNIFDDFFPLLPVCDDLRSLMAVAPADVAIGVGDFIGDVLRSFSSEQKFEFSEKLSELLMKEYMRLYGLPVDGVLNHDFWNAFPSYLSAVLDSYGCDLESEEEIFHVSDVEVLPGYGVAERRRLMSKMARQRLKRERALADYERELRTCTVLDLSDHEQVVFVPDYFPPSPKPVSPVRAAPVKKRVRATRVPLVKVKKMRRPVPPVEEGLPVGFVAGIFERVTAVAPLVSGIFSRIRNAAKRYIRYGKIIAAKQAKKDLKWSVKKLFRNVMFRTPTASLQSGKKLKKACRDVREELQRAAAKAAKKQAWKKKPKRVREALIDDSRDLRDGVPEDVKLQSGSVLYEMAAGGLCVALGGLMTFLGRATAAAERAENVGGLLETVINSLRTFAASLKEHLGKALWIVPLVMTVFYFLYSAKRESPIAETLLIGALSTMVGPLIWDKLADIFRSGSTVLQSGGAPFDFMSVAPKLLATAFTFSVFGAKVTPFMVSEFVKRMGMLDRTTVGWETFLKWMMGGVESLVNWTLVRFGKDRIKIFKDLHEPANQWAKDVNELVCNNETCSEDMGPDNIDRLVKLVVDGYVFKDAYKGTSMERHINEHLARAVSTLRPLQGALNARNNFRVEPATFLLNGPPGIGKTLIAMYVCAAVMLESGLLPAGTSPVELKKNIWQKGNSEYWNGYIGQLCLVMDDIFQQLADKTDKENDYMTLIRAVSSWSFPLNFADLASKGKIYFGSKFIFGTTNLPSIESSCKLVLHDPLAVVRRINHPYTLILNPAFANAEGMLDYTKFVIEKKRCAENATTPMEAFPWHIWSVRKHDFMIGHDIGGDLSLDGVIREVAADLKHRCNTHACAEESLDMFVSGYDKLQSGGRPLPFHTWFNRFPVFDFTKKLIDMENEEAALVALAEESFSTKLLKSVWQTGLTVGFWYLVYKGVRAVIKFLWETLSSLFGYKRKLQSNRPLTKSKPTRVVQPFDAVNAVSQASDSVVASNVYANTFKLHVLEKDGTSTILGQIIFVMSDMALQPNHFTEVIAAKISMGVLSADSKLVFRNALNSEMVINYTVGQYMELKRVQVVGTDVEFVKVKSIIAPRNITRSFIVESDISLLKNRRVRLDVCVTDDKTRIVNQNARQTYFSNTCEYRDSMYAGGKCLGRVFTIEAPTSEGDCGAPLCVNDNSILQGRTCMGMHVAGNSALALGYSCIVTQEMIKKAQLELSIIIDNMAADLERRNIKFQSSFELPFKKKGSFLPIACLDKAVTICPKTSYYRTCLYDSLGPYRCLPAPMSPVMVDGVYVYPMENAVAPYSTPVLHYGQDWLEQAMHVAMKPFTEMTFNADRSIYSFEQSVMGISGRKFRAIPRRTSPGFPYVYDVKDGKRTFFGKDGEPDLSLPACKDLKVRVELLEEEAKQGIRNSVIYMDFLKDELRSPEKVAAVATRLISSSPLDYVVLWRMYFGAFSSEVMETNTRNGMAPGICSFTDTGTLVDMLRKKGHKVFDGDFKGFDSSEQPAVHNLALDYINNWYGDSDENKLVRKVLWMDLVHSRHVGGTGFDQRHIYQWNKSLPSGHPFTTIINSMYSLFLLVSAYISITGDKVGFWDWVSAVVYGDDNVVNPSDAIVGVYNQRTVSAALLKEFSVIYTPGSKTGDFVEYTSLDKLTFLKRSISMRDNTWLCPLELDSFLFTHYWCCNRKLEREIAVDVLENALQELSMHTPELWEKYYKRIVGLLKYYGKTTRSPPNQHSYLAVVLARADNWY